jgi:hypothetical protein
LEPDGSLRTSKRALPNWALALCFVIWAAAVAGGFAVLWRYKSTPADQERPPARWPAQSRLTLSRDRPTLLVFAHPHCPCTQATITEVGRLLARTHDRIATHVLLVEPPGVPANWADTALWQRAATLPGATLWRDEGAREAGRFRARASGLLVLYDTAGRRLFSGGITASRGHEGDSFGRRRLLALIEGRPADHDQTPVFGCALGAHGALPLPSEVSRTQ